jgi:glycosyltransferase involved in cell wall biosynthesis
MITMLKDESPLISIITPCYNSEWYIRQTIESVLAQPYQNWEMIIIDDCSTDNSEILINEYLKKDKRIKYLKTELNTGMPSGPRNLGLDNAKGRYIAFLDGDDIWLPTKLENQLKNFTDENVAIVFSYYEKITEDRQRSNRIVISLEKVTYNQLLKGNSIGCLTAIYDTEKSGKLSFMNFHYEDYAYWLAILKNGYIAKNTNTLEALYRVKSDGESSKKLRSARWTWNIYKNYLKMPLLKCLYCFSLYSLKASFKH